MRLAYLTTDEVNQDLAIHIAADCGTALALFSPRDPPPDGRFDAVLYDWDFWPLHLRREVLEELLTARPPGLVALHGYHIDERHVEALRQNGVAVFHRLERETFQGLEEAAGQARGLWAPGSGPAKRGKGVESRDGVVGSGSLAGGRPLRLPVPE